MNNRHRHGRQPGDEESIHDCNAQLPSLWQRVAGNVGLEAVAPGGAGTLEATRGTGPAHWSGQSPGRIPSTAGLVRAGDVEPV